MPIAVACPNPACSRPLTLPDAAVGQPRRCRHCGHTFVMARSAQGTVAPGEGLTLGGRPPTGSRTEPLLPASFGRFRVLAELGAGAFGTVYRAHDPQLEREVA